MVQNMVHTGANSACARLHKAKDGKDRNLDFQASNAEKLKACNLMQNEVTGYNVGDEGFEPATR